MKRVQKHSIIFVIMALLFLPMITINSISITQNIYQNTNFTTLYVGGTGPGNFTTIQEAIDHATENDSIYVYDDSSPYQEHLTIPISLTLCGENTATTHIWGTVPTDIITIQASHVHLQGFTLEQKTSTPLTAGIHINQQHNITIKNTIIKDCIGYGIKIKGINCKHIEIKNSEFNNNTYAIYQQEGSKTTINTTIFRQNQDAIYLSKSTIAIIINNIFQYNSVGIHLERSNTNIISNNNIEKNDDGIYLFHTTNTTIKNNTISNNRWLGIWLINSSYNPLIDNIILGNVDIGLYLELSDGNEIAYNLFQANDDGIYIEYSTGNQIHHNQFYNIKFNTFFVSHSIKTSKNNIHHNYWERPRLLPYIISGTIKQETIKYPWLTLDVTPLKIPPKITKAYTPISKNQIIYVGGSGPGNFSSIQAAINYAQNGDTIYVYPGIYTESILINKTLTLNGADKQTTIIDGLGRADLLTLTADTILISNFTMYNGHYGIFINNSKNHKIIDNIFSSNLHGISIHHSNSITISNNYFEENPYGIRIYYCTEIIVTNNIFSSFKLDVFFIGSTLKECRHSWYGNNWNKSNILPVPIRGKFQRTYLSMFILNFDWHPTS